MEFALESSLFFIAANIKLDLQPMTKSKVTMIAAIAAGGFAALWEAKPKEKQAEAKAAKTLEDAGMMPVDHAGTSVKFSDCRTLPLPEDGYGGSLYNRPPRSP